MTMIISGTDGLTFNNATTQASAGCVLQVVNATYSTVVYNSTTTYADTGLTASITPKFATSKILVIVNQQGCQKRSGNTGSGLALQLLKNSTSLIVIQGYGGYNEVTTSTYFATCACNYLDSPATTSSVTYKTQFKNETNAAAVAVNGDGSTSTITLMEIAA